MPTIEHHPDGVIVINGKRYRRSQFSAAPRITLRDWCAMTIVLVGIAACFALAVGLVIGIGWFMLQAVREVIAWR